jgi:hypothetical protein
MEIVMKSQVMDIFNLATIENHKGLIRGLELAVLEITDRFDNFEDYKMYLQNLISLAELELEKFEEKLFNEKKEELMKALKESM